MKQKSAFLWNGARSSIPDKLNRLMALALLLGCMTWFFATPAYAAAGEAGDEPATEETETPAEPATTPHVMMSRYEVVEGSLAAGNKVTLRFFFSNSSTQVSANDVLVSFVGDSSYNHPEYGQANQLYVGTIPPGETVSAEKAFEIAPGAPSSILFQMQLIYLNAATETMMSNSITLRVPIFETNAFSSQITLPKTIYADQPCTINGILSNSSASTLYELVLRVEGDIEGETVQTELGDLNIGEQRAFSQDVLFPTVTESAELTLSFSFLDNNGNRIALPPSVYTVQAQVFREMDQPRQKGLTDYLVDLFTVPTPIVLAGSSVVLVLLLIILLLQRLARKRSNNIIATPRKWSDTES